MLSQTCKAAIKSVVYLASRYHSGEKSSILEISAEINVSEHTVGKLLQLLVKRNIINSTKGPMGGFYMTGTQMKQPIINVVEAIDGNGIFKECGLGLSKCSETHACPIHYQFKESRDILKNLFSNSKVGDLCTSVIKGYSFLNG